MNNVTGEFPIVLGHGAEVVTFDLGGTSFRSGFVNSEGRLTDVQRIPSINRWTMPGKSAEEIINEIASYVSSTVKSFQQSGDGKGRRPATAISLGASMNAHTGTILGSGPILGDDSSRLDLNREIRHQLNRGNITIVNDVTASLVAHSHLRHLRSARRLALITISTGIASRILNCSVPHIPVDPTYGTQGEIGHHRIAFSVDGHPFSLKCDCGAMDHVNAFASGHGIKSVMLRTKEVFPEEFMDSALGETDLDSSNYLGRLTDGLANGDSLSEKLLKAVTAPVAEAIKWHFTLDPEIDKLILTGGVCFQLNELYLSSVIDNLCQSDFYPLASHSRDYWVERVILGPVSDDAGLLGAAYIARESPKIHQRETLNLAPPYRVSRQTVNEYPVEVVHGMLQGEDFPDYLLRPFERILLFIDSNVDDLYGDLVRDQLAGRDREVESVVLRLNEKQKDMFTFMEVIGAFEKLGIRRRRDLVVAAGGGITLDVVGFAASVFRRGIPFMRLPTTLVAEIDAGIGIKTGINFRQSKSRVGTFANPYAVVVDPCFLSTLSDRQIRNGLSEALKIALVADRRLFEIIEENADHLVGTKLQCKEGTELIHRSIRAMLVELSSNLYEKILERRPDYGHTFSPVLEFHLSDLEHGEAVAIDMAVSTAIAASCGILDTEKAERILFTQHALGLPIHRPGMTLDMLLQGIHDAKKHRGGHLRMPILSGIGEVVFLNEIQEHKLEEALDFVRSWENGKAVAQHA